MDLNLRKFTFWYVLPTKIQISLRIRADWLESSSSTNFAFLAIQNAPSENSKQTAQMHRLIRISMCAHLRRYVFGRCDSNKLKDKSWYSFGEIVYFCNSLKKHYIINTIWASAR